MISCSLEVRLLKATRFASARSRRSRVAQAAMRIIGTTARTAANAILGSKKDRKANARAMFHSADAGPMNVSWMRLVIVALSW